MSVAVTGPNCSHGAITKETDAYWSFNMAHTIAEGSTSLTLTYDSEHARVTQALTTASTTTTTNYLNDPISGVMAEKVATGSTNTWNDYLMVDGRLIGERTCTAPTPTCASGATLQYFVLDHLGSVAVVTDGTAAVTSRESFDAWGKQRNEDGSDDATCSNGLTAPTTRGFTSQEEIATFCLVNLNARIYDPTIGRFMAADTIVPDPYDGQSYNRYSYTDNRPLSFTDTTGHSDEGFYYNLNLLPPDSYPNASCSGPGCGTTSSGFEIGGTIVITSMKIGVNSNGEIASIAPDKSVGDVSLSNSQTVNESNIPPSNSNYQSTTQTAALNNSQAATPGSNDGVETVVVERNRLPRSLGVDGVQLAQIRIPFPSAPIVGPSGHSNYHITVKQLTRAAAKALAGPEDKTYVVRGGQCLAVQFCNGTDVTIDANGNLQGVSVQSFPDTSLQELSKNIPNKQIGWTTLQDVQNLGGTVVADPEEGDPYHAILGGISPLEAHILFSPTIPNPNLPPK